MTAQQHWSSNVSKKHSTIAPILAFAMLAAWQAVQAADDTQKQRDGARLVLLREHAETIAKSDKAADKQAAIDAFHAIVTDYFLATRIKFPPAGDQQAQALYLRQVSPLHKMIVQAKQGDAEAFKTMPTLIEEFRAALYEEGKPAPEPEAMPTPKGSKSEETDSKTPDAKEGDSKQGDTAFQISETERLLYKIVNAYRKKQGLGPLKLDEGLCLAARDHSGDMNKHSFFSHDSPVPGRAKFTHRAKLRGSSANAENIARDCKDAEMAMKLWVNSQHHRANLTGSQTRIGVGIDERGFYTQLFGN